jgi:hypothetical protein
MRDTPLPTHNGHYSTKHLQARSISKTMTEAEPEGALQIRPAWSGIRHGNKADGRPV